MYLTVISKVAAFFFHQKVEFYTVVDTITLPKDQTYFDQPFKEKESISYVLMKLIISIYRTTILIMLGRNHTQTKRTLESL